MSSIYDKSSLVLIPSGTKVSKVYSQKPVSGDGDFTFTRSSAATRINADGNIEKETSNLLLQSNSFNTTWLNAATTETSGQAGYDGTNDAWRIDKSNSGAYIYQNISQSGVQTFSVYAKAGTSTWIQVVANGSSNALSFFDLDNGVLGATSSNIISRDITSAGNGYYRCSISVNIGTIARVRFYVAEGDNDTSATSGNIYIQDAQLEQGMVARDVLTTTTTAVEGGITDNVPRLDYTDSSCPALLLEPQRTNIFLTSEWFGVWDLNAGTTLTYNYATSPERVQNATRYVGTGASGFGDKFTLTNGTQYTISAYVKSNTGATQYCRLIGDSSNISSDLEVTTEWTRIDYTWTSGGLTNKTNGIFRDSSNNDIDILVYGLQLEAGSYATSYIPTYGTSVTRNQATCLTASPSTSLFGQTEGTIYTEIKINAITSGSYSRVFNLKNSAGSNQVYFQQNDSRINSVVFNGSNQFTQSTSSGFLSVGSTYKMAMAYKNGDYALYINGTQIGTSTATGLGTLAVDRVDLTTLVGNIPLGNELKKSLVFNTRLSNEELADLTTL